jgi:patatin-related protein
VIPPSARTVASQPNGAAAAHDRSAPDEKSREVRLGLVMYGGVSLAIYINGVAREFHRAVRGRGVYRLVKALTDSDIVVDVLSGTSAGGINGLFLAYALCNGREFKTTATLWREHGGIRELLRNPFHGSRDTSSILDSEGYYQPRLEEAFQYMGEYTPELGEDPSDMTELDLFITGTDVDGVIYTQFDDAGHPIDVKDHRAVFLLKHRAGRKEPLNPKGTQRADPAVTYGALAKLARITSCFPAAFASVHVADAPPDDSSVDGKLQQWGSLDREACFLDGGVLDNKPFTHTLKAIFARTASCDVDRKLFFIEPDPECFQRPKTITPPNFLQSALTSMIGIPRYESIADDLKLLAERNTRLQRYRDLVVDIQDAGKRGAGDDRELSEETGALYRRSRLLLIAERVIQGVFHTGGRDSLIDREYREKARELIEYLHKSQLDGSHAFRRYDIYFLIRRVYHLIYYLHETVYQGKPVAADDATANLRSLVQVLNRQVRLYQIVLSAMERMVDEARIEWKTMETGSIWRLVENILRELLDEESEPGHILPATFIPGTEWLPSEVLSGVNAALKNRASSILAKVADGTFRPEKGEKEESLLSRFYRYERSIIDHYLPKAVAPKVDDPARRAWERFTRIDAVLLPLEMASGIHEKDIIETIRISPRDAQRGFSSNSLMNKVSGDAVYHFGGFFKRSWRSNDILWGRLDGTCQLVETLLDRSRVKQIVELPVWRQIVRDRFLKGVSEDGAPIWNSPLDPRHLFPNAGEPTHRALSEWLFDLLSEDEADRVAALEASRFDAMLTLLVEAEQLEILFEEVPNVITDAVAEQGEWNRYQIERSNRGVPSLLNGSSNRKGRGGAVDGGGETPAWIFKAPSGRLDPFVHVVAAAKVMLDEIDRFNIAGGTPTRPIDTRLGTFFRQGYRVGSEQLTRDIPTPVLLGILATALLVVRNCIIGLFGERARSIKAHPLYKFGLDWPLRAFYGMTTIAQRSPHLGIGIFFATMVICILALLVGTFWWGPIINPPSAFQPQWFIVFLAAPAIILMLQLAYLVWGGWLGRLPSWWTATLASLSFIALVVAIVVPDRLISFSGERELIRLTVPAEPLRLLIVAIPTVVLLGLLLTRLIHPRTISTGTYESSTSARTDN